MSKFHAKLGFELVSKKGLFDLKKLVLRQARGWRLHFSQAGFKFAPYKPMFGETKYRDKKEALIYKRRTVENYYAQNEKNVRDYNNVKANVNHWSREEKRYARHLVTEAEKKKLEEQQKAQELEQKRIREEKAAEEKLKNQKVAEPKQTVAQRLALLEKEALKLEEENQAKRREFVKKAEQKRLIQSSDELRAERSRLLVQYCDAERRKMTEQKRLEKIQEERQKQQFAAVWLKEAKEKEEREAREQEERRKRNQQFYQDIDAQNIKKLNEKREREEQHKREIQELYVKLKAEYEEEEKKRAEQARLKKKRREETLEELREAERRRDQRRLRELQADKEWVEKVVQKEQNKESNTAELKRKFREDQERYMEYNRQLKEMAEENDKLINEHAMREQEKMWLKREAAWNKEQEARERLARQVQLERIEQRQEKLRRDAVERQRDEVHYKKMMNRVTQQEQAEQKKHDELMKRRTQLREETYAAMMEREERILKEKLAEKQSIEQETGDWERLVEEQKQLMRKMAAENPEEFFRHQKITANWYTT